VAKATEVERTAVCASRRLFEARYCSTLPPQSSNLLEDCCPIHRSEPKLPFH
jgi:hypothetical protein